MARDLYTVKTRDEAIEEFERDILPLLIIEETEWQGGTWREVDEIHRSETWNNWTDWQYDNWSHPDCCES